MGAPRQRRPAAAPAKRRRRLRLVHVTVVPKFILDDGENVTEMAHDPVVIPASEWPTYSSERFPKEVKAWQEKIDAETGEEDPC